MAVLVALAALHRGQRFRCGAGGSVERSASANRPGGGDVDACHLDSALSD